MLVHKYCRVNDYSLESLRTEKAFFATRELLNDPFDCTPRADYTLSEQEVDELYRYAGAELTGLESYETKLEPLKEIAVSFLGHVGIYCVTTNPKSELMWAHYGANHCGMAIGWSTEVKRADSPETMHHIPQEVKYEGRGVIRGHDVLEFARDREGKSSLNDSTFKELVSRLAHASYLSKNPAWKYERERRFVSHIGGGLKDFGAEVACITYGYRLNDEQRETVRANLPRLVDEYEIVLGDSKLIRQRIL